MAGIYIHIPFCSSKCIYCDFYSLTKHSNLKATIAGIITEYENRKHEISDPIATIYIGGGTPSIVPDYLLRQIVEHLPQKNIIEFTIEANPDNVTPQIVHTWRDLGINRVSLGIQTLHDKVLKSIGRRHTAQQALDAINIINDAGIQNISADLIYGLPGIDQAMWESDLTTILSSPIKHLSAYSLTYTEGTMLYKMWKQGRITPLSDEETEQRFRVLRQMTSEAGFEHYEISNFALPGFRSLHNSTYWNPKGRWLGLGPSAHSFDGHTRRVSIPDTTKWIEHLPYPCTIDEETNLDRINDIIVTSLRTVDGLTLDSIPSKYHQTLLRYAAPHIANGNMSLKSNTLSINPDQWLMSDTYIRDMIII